MSVMHYLTHVVVLHTMLYFLNTNKRFFLYSKKLMLFLLIVGESSAAFSLLAISKFNTFMMSKYIHKRILRFSANYD